jgi:hypothetical protein
MAIPLSRELAVTSGSLRELVMPDVIKKVLIRAFAVSKSY